MCRLAALVTVLFVVVVSYADDKLTRGQPPTSKVTVKAQIWFQDQIELDTDKNELTMILFINYIWDHPALAYEGTEVKVLTPQEASKLWDPHINFVNAREFEIMHGPDEQVFTMIRPNGTVWRNIRAKVTIPCGSYGERYDCITAIESYMYNAAQVDLQWTKNEPVALLNNGVLKDWVVKTTDTTRQTFEYPAGKWAQLTMKLSLTKPGWSWWPF